MKRRKRKKKSQPRKRRRQWRRQWKKRRPRLLDQRALSAVDGEREAAEASSGTQMQRKHLLREKEVSEEEQVEARARKVIGK